MGQVGAGHDKGAAACKGLGQGLAEALAEFRIVRAHDGGNDLRLGEEDLDEGHLDLDGMLLLVEGHVEAAVIRFCERHDHFPVDGGNAQGRPEPVSGIEGDAVEGGGTCGWSPRITTVSYALART